MKHYPKQVPGGLLLLLIWEGSPLPRAATFGLLAAIYGCLLEYFCEEYTSELFVHTYPIQILSMVTGFGLVFRLNLSMQRYWEARSAVQAMSSKWGDAALQIITFDEASSGEEALHGPIFRAHMVHLFSLLHSLALDKMRQCDSLEQLQLLQPRDNAQRNCQVANNDLRMHFMSNPLTVLGDMDARERESLSASTEHVHLVMTWIHRALVRRSKEGGISVPPPIASRIYQVLSDGMLHCRAALKFRDTPFPFPYAQINALFCFVHLVLYPLVVSSKIKGLPITAFVTFCGIWMLYSLNEVARELEDPFGGATATASSNLIDTTYLHDSFSARLLAALCGSSHPHGSAGEVHAERSEAASCLRDVGISWSTRKSPLGPREVKLGGGELSNGGAHEHDNVCQSRGMQASDLRLAGGELGWSGPRSPRMRDLFQEVVVTPRNYSAARPSSPKPRPPDVEDGREDVYTELREEEEERAYLAELIAYCVDGGESLRLKMRSRAALRILRRHVLK